MFEAVDLAAVIGSLPRRYLDYAYAGGAKLPGAHRSGYALLVTPKEDHEAYGEYADMTFGSGAAEEPVST